MIFFKEIINLFFPEVCLCCKEPLTTQEFVVCIACRHELPLTHFSIEKENLVKKSFYGRIPIENATALFYFRKKGKVQQLIHELKYNNQQNVGIFIGNWLGDELVNSRLYSTVNAIIPVPLHQKKLKKRGYNQLTKFGKQLSSKLNIPYIDNVLLKVSSTKTQTKKLRLERWKNVQELFVIQNASKLEGKHILLIDDIITTGATLEACCNALLNIKDVKISIACMAYTK